MAGNILPELFHIDKLHSRHRTLGFGWRLRRIGTCFLRRIAASSRIVPDTVVLTGRLGRFGQVEGPGRAILGNGAGHPVSIVRSAERDVPTWHDYRHRIPVY